MNSTVETPTAVLQELFPSGPEAVPPITRQLDVFVRLVHCEPETVCPVNFYREEELHNPERRVRTLTSQREAKKTGMALVRVAADGFDADQWLDDQSRQTIAIGEAWRYTAVGHDFFKTAHDKKGHQYFAKFARAGYRPFVYRKRYRMPFGTVTDLYV